MKVLAVDFGKGNSVACDLASDTGEHRFETCQTVPAALEQLLLGRQPDRVVIEVGPSAGWFADLAARHGIEYVGRVSRPGH